MKKLIVFGFAVATAVVANAASFAWAALSVPKVGDTSSVGLNAYLVDASKVDRATMIAALEAGDFQYMKADNYLLTTTTAAQGTAGLSRISLTSGSATAEKYSAYTVILDGAVGSANNFLVTQQLTDVANPGYGGGLGNVSMSFGQQTSASWTAVAPEPTSGLLMLVGLGTLALRRRKA